MPGDSGALFRNGLATVTNSSQPAGTLRHRRHSSDVDLLRRLPALVKLADWSGICAIGLVADSALQTDHPVRGALEILLGSIVFVNCLQWLNAYVTDSFRNLAAQAIKIFAAWSAALAALTLVAAGTDRSHEFLKDWSIAWYFASLVYLLTSRWFLRRQILQWEQSGRLARNIAVAGDGPSAIALAKRLGDAGGQANIVGVFIDGESSGEGEGVAGNLRTLSGLAESGIIDEVIFALPWHSPKALKNAIGLFAASQVEIGLEPGTLPADFPPQEICLLGDVPMITVQRRPLAGWGGPIKRMEDLLIASTMLMLLAPLFILIAVLIKVDSRGPVLFRQQRYGFNNNRIMVWKFRSMYHDPKPDPSVPQARRNDPRVTGVGSILRRTSLDELPQLFNVIQGNMSLVGPRPHADAHNEKYALLIDRYLERHRMKPGITGWAQVNGSRGETTTTEQMKRRVSYDLHYIAHWSLLFDIKVLVLTVPAVLGARNAY
jgi:putative colanic acid biosynthesis UDP-glucose lipid carrier transferase